MPRRPNYGAEKRSKQLDKQRKREEKEEKKRARREAAAESPETTSDGEPEVAGQVRARAQADGNDGEDARDE